VGAREVHVLQRRGPKGEAADSGRGGNDPCETLVRSTQAEPVSTLCSHGCSHRGDLVEGRQQALRVWAFDLRHFIAHRGLERVRSIGGHDLAVRQQDDVVARFGFQQVVG